MILTSPLSSYLKIFPSAFYYQKKKIVNLFFFFYLKTLDKCFCLLKDSYHENISFPTLYTAMMIYSCFCIKEAAKRYWKYNLGK